MRIYEDLRGLQTRVGVFQSILVALFGLLLATFWSLQVLRGKHFRELAENNRTRTVTLAAPRGPLVDRDGRQLVENRPAFSVILNLDQSEDLDRTVAGLARSLGTGEAWIRERLARRQQFRPVVVRADASIDEIAAVEARRYELSSVSVEVVPLRSYPLATAAAHVLGRVGEVTTNQRAQPEFEDIPPGSLVGQAGVETQYNRQLMGQDGLRKVVVNSRGLEVGETERVAPVDGTGITLTLDASLQKDLEAGFSGRGGGAVFLDPRNGEILAMASTPSYDPNSFTTGIEAREWSELVSDPATPLINRCIQGAYSPGSTFKILVSIAGLEEGVITPSTVVSCSGQLAVYGTVFHCNRPGGHGVMDLRHAIAQSCNVFFYTMGMRLEINRLATWAKRLGLGRPTGVDLPNEASGLMPSPEWKQRAHGEPWYGGETVSVAIGQGQVSATPIQMAVVAAAVANGGHLVRPHLLRRVGSGPLAECGPGVAPPCTPPAEDLGLKPSTLQAVREGMISVVAEGTGWRARLPNVAVAGKTGSAQVVARSRLERDKSEKNQPHGWFVGFAPADNPRVAFAILVEHGRAGGESAAPLAREVLSHYLGPGTSATTIASADATGVPQAARSAQ